MEHKMVHDQTESKAMLKNYKLLLQSSGPLLVQIVQSHHPQLFGTEPASREIS